MCGNSWHLWLGLCALSLMMTKGGIQSTSKCHVAKFYNSCQVAKHNLNPQRYPFELMLAYRNCLLDKA